MSSTRSKFWLIVKPLLVEFLFLCCLLVGPISFSGELKKSPKKLTPPEVILPTCVSDPAVIKKIETTQKNNSKSKFKYDGYKEVFRTEAEGPQLARLIYAETLAANCPAQQKEILPLIANTIVNRIRFRKGQIGSVIYERDQFASSLNIYAESRYQDFLCPKDLNLWRLALKTAQNSLSASLHEANANDSLPEVWPKDVVNYYLYQHSPRFKAPNWKLPEFANADSEKVKSCIRFFRNAKWR